MDAELMRRAELHLRLERHIGRQIGLDIVAIHAIHAGRIQTTCGDVIDQLGREDNVDVGRQDETPARAADPHVFRNHLKQRQHIGVAQLLVQFGRDLDEPIGARGDLGQPEQFADPRFLWRRVPFDDDHLGVETGAPALLVEVVDEGLQSFQRITAMIIVARRDDDAQIGRR